MPKMLSIELEDGLNDGLRKIAEHSDRSVEELHWIALKMFVDQELEHLNSVLDGIADHEAGRVVTQEQVEAWVESCKRSGKITPAPKAQPLPVQLAR
jgi:predicted transcriptional regulator